MSWNSRENRYSPKRCAWSTSHVPSYDFEELKLIRLQLCALCAIGGRTHHAFTCLNFRIFSLKSLAKILTATTAHETSKSVALYFLLDFAMRKHFHTLGTCPILQTRVLRNSQFSREFLDMARWNFQDNIFRWCAAYQRCQNVLTMCRLQDSHLRVELALPTVS